jgi:deoxyuridine 5'-triphosphate nucleotidohydrolase
MSIENIIDEKSAYEAGLIMNDKNDFEEIYLPDVDKLLVWHLLRGYFEGNKVQINNPKNSVYELPFIRMEVIKAAFLEKVCTFTNTPMAYSFNENKGVFTLSGTNGLDFLGKLYEGAKVYKRMNYDAYYSWCRYCMTVFPHVQSADVFEWCKTREDAIAPSKERVSDSGYDLTIVDVVKKFHSKTTLYTTGIKVKPSFGWYLDVVPRSSIIKSGYMLANNVGIIDRAYNGEIMIALIKVDESAPDLELPCRIAQMIPRRIAHVQLTQVDDIEKTTRNDGGFGSTG